MSGVNKWIGIGRLGADPSIAYTANGDAVCNLSLAVSETWKDKNGEKQERIEWVKIVAFKKLAEIMSEYLVKGKQVYIEGRIQTRQWDDKDGNKRYTTEIVANQMQMLGGGDGQKTGSNPAYGTDDDSSIPF